MEFSVQAMVCANLGQTLGKPWANLGPNLGPNFGPNLRQTTCYILGLGSGKPQAKVWANLRFGFRQTLDLGFGKPLAWVQRNLRLGFRQKFGEKFRTIYKHKPACVILTLSHISCPFITFCNFYTSHKTLCLLKYSELQYLIESWNADFANTLLFQYSVIHISQSKIVCILSWLGKIVFIILLSFQ